jgi:succinate dehydrogenase / fumarate reductase flavoprotein subunit
MAAATPRIIVVGGGLAGLSAVIKIAEAGGKVDLFSIVPVKRSHSVCAQGGINSAKNLKGEDARQADVRARSGYHRPARPHGRAL